MIFVTVGTHEQQFNRLVKKIDDLKKEGIIDEEVIVQIGYSTYEPRYCTWKKLFPYSEIERSMNNARIIITHGGPSSFIMPLQIGKVPVVVPRKYEFGEHINNHQVEFTNAILKRNIGIIVVKDIEELSGVIMGYDDLVSKMTARIENNNKIFCQRFEKIVQEMLV